MKKYLFYILTAISVLAPFLSSAKLKLAEEDEYAPKKKQKAVRRMFIAYNSDAAIFSSATITKGGVSSMGELRFSYVANVGLSYNVNITRHLGVYTGIDVKNLGYIEHIADSAIKRRTYNVGIPIGIKVGNMATRGYYLFLGGGVDVPVNYKEKGFALNDREHKKKFDEWFSDRTPAIMPYVFAGVHFKTGATLKFQYYTGNFINPDFVQGTTVPYASNEVHIFLVSFGVQSPVRKLRSGDRVMGGVVD